MSRTNGENRGLISVSVDGSQEDQVNHKVVRSLLPQNNLTVDLTATSNSEHNSVHTDDDDEYYLPTWILSTTYDKENDENGGLI